MLKLMSKVFLLLFVIMMMGQSLAIRETITLQNPSFELPDLPSSGRDYNPPTDWEDDGWGYAWVYNVPAASPQYPLPEGYGEQTIYTPQSPGIGIAQTTGETIQGNMLYTLTVSFFAYDGDYNSHGRLYFYAYDETTEESTLILQGDDIEGTIPEGEWVEVSLHWDSTDSEYIGQKLRVRIVAYNPTAVDMAELTKVSTLPTEITLQNPSFELPDLANSGDRDYNPPTDWEDDGWGYAWVYNIPAASPQYPLPTGHGEQTIYTPQSPGIGIAQTTDETIEDNTLYTFSAWFFANNGDSHGRLSFYAYDETAQESALVLEGSDIAGEVSEGVWTKVTLRWDSTGSDYIGQKLRVKIMAYNPTAVDMAELVGVPSPPVLWGGKMTAFWRTCMMTGGNDQVVPWHMYQNPVAYLDATDFPYSYSKYGLDPTDSFVLHADQASYVRFLSRATDPIYTAYELALRVAGEVDLQEQKVAARFAATEASGAIDNYTIVLDNVPFCFPEPEDIRIATYGQTAMPADMNEWEAFIVDLCEELKNILGEQKANNLRFRMGTEAHDGKRYFYTDPQVMLDFYKITAEAVKSVLPSAKFGPYNTNGPWNPAIQILEFPDLVEFCMTNDLPLDFIGYSWYVRGNAGDPTGPSPFVDHWEEAEAINPALIDVPKEFHEFGALGISGSLYVRPSCDNAAGMFNMLMDARAAGLDGTYHWPVDVPIAYSPSTYVLNGSGWLFQVLDHTTGGASYLLDANTNDLSSDSIVRALGAFDCDDTKSYLIVSSFNTSASETDAESVQISIPKTLMTLDDNWDTVQAAALDRDNCPLYAIRKDIEDAGYVTSTYLAQPNCTLYSPVHFNLLGVTDWNAAQSYIVANRQKYVDLCTDSFTLKDKAVSIIEGQSNYEITLSMKANSIMVIDLKNFSATCPGSPPVIEEYKNVITTTDLLPAMMTAAITEVCEPVNSVTFTLLGDDVEFPAGANAILTDTTVDNQNPTATLTTDTEGVYKIKLEASDGTNTAEKIAEVVVYADACQAKKDSPSGWIADSFDLDENCLVDLLDFAELAEEWLDGTNILDLTGLAAEWLNDTSMQAQETYIGDVSYIPTDS